MRCDAPMNYKIEKHGKQMSNADTIDFNNYPDAPDPDPVESFFQSEADAAAEALRLFTLYASGFTAYRFTLKNAIFVHAIGEVVNVTDDRLGLSTGRYVRLVELSDDSSTMSTECVGFG